MAWSESHQGFWVLTGSEDVAAAAGVSMKTVSRVLNNEPNVRDAMRQRVETAFWMDEHGFYAQALDGEKRPIRRLVVPRPSSLSDPFTSVLARRHPGSRLDTSAAVPFLVRNHGSHAAVRRQRQEHREHAPTG